MTSIQPTGGSGIANLPSATSISSPSDVPNDGLQWGINVGASEGQNYDPNFNFDNYANDVAASMTLAGFSPSQVTVNAMYAGYLLQAGDATSQATGALGSGPSTAGMAGNPGTWDSLALPGQEGAAGIEVAPSTTVGLTPSTALMLSQQLGSQPGNIKYPQWRANLEADLQRAGSSQTDVDAFMGQFDKAYYSTVGASTSPRDDVIGGTQDGATVAASFGNQGFDLEQYIAGTLLPYLTNDLSGGTSQNTGLIDQANLEGADLVAQNQPNFNLDDYIDNTLKGSDLFTTLNQQQQAMYINALTAGYLRAGGTQTTSATTVGAPGVSVNTQNPIGGQPASAGAGAGHPQSV